MDEFESLSHTKWECKYHVVFIPKFRRKALYGQLRDHLGELLRKLATQKESRIEEGHLMPDHVHMMISIPPKYAVSQVIGYVKGKSAIHLARVYGERRRNFVGQHFWARGYRPWGETSITLDQLRAQGRSVWEMAQRMNRVLDGRELFSDKEHSAGTSDEPKLARSADES